MGCRGSSFLAHRRNAHFSFCLRNQSHSWKFFAGKSLEFGSQSSIAPACHFVYWHSVCTGSPSNVDGFGGNSNDLSKWKCKSIVTLALTLLTSSQAILIVWSKRAGKYEYSVTSANFLVEALKCALSLAALVRIWKNEGVTEDNRLTTTFDEVSVYPIPAGLYLIKNLLQYYIFAYVDAPGYQILKNLNVISTGLLYRIILKEKMSIFSVKSSQTCNNMFWSAAALQGDFSWTRFWLGMYITLNGAVFLSKISAGTSSELLNLLQKSEVEKYVT